MKGEFLVHKLRVGIIGVGMAFERLHYPAYQKLQDKYEIVALCDPNSARAEKWCQPLGLKPEDVYTNQQSHYCGPHCGV